MDLFKIILLFSHNFFVFLSPIWLFKKAGADYWSCLFKKNIIHEKENLFHY